MTTLPIRDRALSTSPSAVVAAELRAEMGRQGMRQNELARRLRVTEAWVSRRIAPGAGVELRLEEIVNMAKALDLSVERLLVPLLPRLDSNQQPSGYPLSLVNGGARLTLCRLPGNPRHLQAVPEPVEDEDQEQAA